MAERPTSLYTRTGDNGTTGLLGGKRINKDNARIHTIGEVDELNCQLGVVRSLCRDEQTRGFIREIQNVLFELGAELASPSTSRLVRPHIARMEQFIDRLNESLPPLDSFVLPGGVPEAAHCHLARAVCRRAERSLFRLSRTEHVNSASLQFINRLSDLLFVLARTLNHRAAAGDELWRPFAKEKRA